MTMQAQARICPVCFDDHPLENLCKQSDLNLCDMLPESIRDVCRNLAKAELEREEALKIGNRMGRAVVNGRWSEAKAAYVEWVANFGVAAALEGEGE